MSTFHVFVEGAVEQGDAALERLATAMSARYGLPAAELISRMKRGRFRVKANIDRATADTYVKDLKTIGARAVVEEGRLQSQPSMQVPNLPIAAPPEPPARNSAQHFTSGLSAAYAPSEAKMDLGALGGDNQTFNLSSIDGESVGVQTPPAVEARFVPPPLPASVAPPKPKPATPAKPAKPNNDPIDMFAPPGSEEEAELKVELAPDDDFRQRKASIPPVTAPVEASAMPSMRRNPSLPPMNVSPEQAKVARGGPLADARTRMIVGTVLAIAIGFVPAHIVASVREKSAFATIDARVIAAGRAVTNDAELTALDDYRATELATKKSSRRNIALVSMLIWAVVGAGAGYVWFRRIPWNA